MIDAKGFERLFSERSSVLFDEALPHWYANGQQERFSAIGKARRRWIVPRKVSTAPILGK
jgi:hypothetical protein